MRRRQKVRGLLERQGGQDADREQLSLGRALQQPLQDLDCSRKLDELFSHFGQAEYVSVFQRQAEHHLEPLLDQVGQLEAGG